MVLTMEKNMASDNEDEAGECEYPAEAVRMAYALGKADASKPVEPEDLARKFHEIYERLAPEYGYKTREASAVHWDDVPEGNKRLMIAVCKEILDDG